MKTYLVSIPIAGHVVHEVEAESPEEAIGSAQIMDPEDGEVTWETLSQFHKGNVCYCPTPWKIETEEIR